MKKVIIQGLVTILLFFAVWFALTQVDWMSIFKVEKNLDKLETKLGEVFMDIFRKSDKEVKDPFVLNVVDSLVSTICEENDISGDRVKVHIIENKEVNAFALPDAHLILYTGLITEATNQEELAGVICHELAHIELGHVMKKLIREVGLNTLFSATTGSNGSEIATEALRALSSTAYDRSLESEADLKAADYLVNANINPSPFAGFLYRLPDLGGKMISWISTHPDSKSRADALLEYTSKNNTEYRKVVSEEGWDRMILVLKEDSDKSL